MYQHRDTLIRIPIAVLLLTVMGVLPYRVYGQEGRQDDIVGFLLEGNRANLESFGYVKTKFRVIRGFSPSFEDAMEGRWVTDHEPIVCHTFLAISGPELRRDDEYSEEDIRKNTRVTGNMTVASLATRRIIQNATLEAIHEPGQIFHVAEKGRFFAEGHQPFGIGKTAPLYKAAAYVKTTANGSVRYVGERQLDGRALPVLEMRQEYSPDWEIQALTDYFWLDPERGYVPIRIETHFNDEKEFAQITIVEEMRQFSDDRWLPVSYRYVDRRKKPKGIACTEVIVDEIDCDDPPSSDIFELDIPSELNGYNYVTQQLIRSKTGVLTLATFRGDGTLQPDQVDFDVVAKPSNHVRANRPNKEESSSAASSFRGRVSLSLFGLALVAAAVIVILRIFRRAV